MYKGTLVGLSLLGALVAMPVKAVLDDTQKVFSIFTEQGNKAETSGFSLGLRKVDHNDFYLQLGLSYQRITLKQQPADYYDGRIRPMFLYGRVGMDGWIGPYFQAGLDLNGSLLQWANSNSDSNSCCHAMARAGLEVKLQQNIRLELYGNYYNLQYQSLYLPSTPNDYLGYVDNKRFSRTTVGAQLSLLF